MNELAEIMPALKRILSMAVIVAGIPVTIPIYRCWLKPFIILTLQYVHTVLWAIGKLGGKNAKELLITAQAKEKDRDVQREISLALQRLQKSTRYNNISKICLATCKIEGIGYFMSNK